MSGLTSHVLDLALGQPARGLGLRLDVLEVGGWRPLAAAVTDDDGRAGDLLAGAPLEARTYPPDVRDGQLLCGLGPPFVLPAGRG